MWRYAPIVSKCLGYTVLPKILGVVMSVDRQYILKKIANKIAIQKGNDMRE